LVQAPRQTTDAASGPIRGDAAAMLREAVANAGRWDYLTLAPRLKDRAVFLAATTTEAEAMRVTLTESLRPAGAASAPRGRRPDGGPASSRASSR
jgi:hypothetical protein